MDEDADPMERPLNVVEKLDEWTEGNYLSVGRGSSSAHEKILAMNVPLHAYDVHRRFREELWTAEKVAENMAKHAQLQKQRMKMEEMNKQSEKQVEKAPATLRSAAAGSELNSAKSSVSASADASPKEQTSVSSLPSTSSTSTVKTKALPPHDKDSNSSSQSSSPPPPAPAATPAPIDRRFAPEKIARLPWYRKLYNYTPPPTGWTADEDYGHRSYIIPHPIRAAKDNLMRSWATVLTPTWKVTKALVTSFTSGSQIRVWNEAWKYSWEGGQMKLVNQARESWKKRMLEEEERQEKEKAERGERSPPSS